MSRISDSFFRNLNKGLAKADQSFTDRVVLLVDMDCFYCQVEEKLNTSLAGKPIAVVQYNAWKGGGIIAVNYPARNKGVSRHMRGDEAKKICPEIELVRVPNIRGKADLTKYREAGKQVAEVLKKFTPLLERASVDEAYLDITESVEKRILHQTKKITEDHLKNTFVVGSTIADFLNNLYDDENLNASDLKLGVGGIIAELLRAQVYKETGYQCSAGVAHNKVLAKLACGLNKPNKQTILPWHAVTAFFEKLPVTKIQGLGGKFGNSLLDNLGIQFMGDLLKFSERELVHKFDEKNGTWLYNIARGIDVEPVTTRLVSKSIGCCKKFPGKTALTTSESIQHWLNELAEEIIDRLEQDMLENNRKAKQIVVSYAQEIDKKDVSGSKTTFLHSYNQKRIADDTFAILKKQCMKSDGSFCLKFLGLSAGNFENCKNVRAITTFFKNECKRERSSTTSTTEQLPTADKIYKGMENRLSETNKNVANKEKVHNPQSVYDASTDEQSSVNSEELFFYEDSLTKKPNCGEPIEAPGNYSNENSSDVDSISNEILSSSQKAIPEGKQDAKGISFFVKYLDDMKTKSENQALRNFNTSKVLENNSSASEDDSTSECVEEEHETSEYENNYPSEARMFDNILNNPSTSSADGKVPCPECGKRVFESDMVSHMDYHLALKIVRSEADLYKPNKSINESKITKVSGKRKAMQSEGQRTLESFIKTNAMGDREECETCSECNKRICITELESHKDYHVAKKLHIEINPGATPLKNVSISKKNSKSKTKHDGKIKPVTAFFKLA